MGRTLASMVRNGFTRGRAPSGLEWVMHRWCAVGSLVIVMTIAPLAGIVRGAVPEASVTWHEVGEGVWDLLGVSRDHKTAYLIHDRLSAIQGNKETKVAYRLLAVDLTSLKITPVVPTKVIEKDRYLVFVVNREHFFVGRAIAYLSPDKTKVALTGERYCEDCYFEPTEKIFLLDLKTLSEKLLNAQHTVRGYRKQAMYARAGPDAFSPPTWAFPRGWLSNHEILYSSERTGDGESLWVLDIRNQSERLLLKFSELRRRWGRPIIGPNTKIISGRRLLISTGSNRWELEWRITDVQGKILHALPYFSSECLAPDGKKVILAETSSKTGGTMRLPPVVQNLDTGQKIPLPLPLEIPSPCYWFWWEDDGVLARFFSSPADPGRLTVAVMELDERNKTATLKIIPPDPSKGSLELSQENRAAAITWLDRTHLLLTTIKAQPYVQGERRELTTWIITLR